MEDTPSSKLAKEYVSLGGKRMSKLDDNLTSVRKWENDPPEAEAFWRNRIETLSEQERVQVEKLLPSMNSV